MQQLRNYSLAHLYITPPIRLYSYIILDLCTPMGAVPKSLGKLELSGARGSGDAFWALGANARKSWNTKIDGGSMKVMSKFITIKDPSSTGAMAVIKEKATTCLKVKSYQAEKAKAARLRRDAGY
ncbi:hypothetical protein HOY82DRAFT_652426 [Tuber indicum]|nr:hypothetical protein HOY82DRAFT_652426 [Tuber indicum]